jgi:hypothetical protein
MRVLQEMGHDVEIVNYKNKRHHYMEDIRPWFKYRRPVRFIDRIKKQRAFGRDQTKLQLSDFTTNPESVKQMEYDVLVVGSDVVWNHMIFGYDELYFGGVPAKRKISYAPSFGWVNAKGELPISLKEDLSRFDAISVRDENSKEIIQSVLGIDPPLVLDPTLIYDFKEEERSSVWPSRLGNYLLVYAYSVNEKTIKSVREYAAQNNLKIIAVGYREDWCDMNLMSIGPLEWLSLFKNAHTVLTSTFHGLVFSLKNEKNFFYISNNKAKNRVVSLLNTCGIKTELPFMTDGQVEFLQPNYSSVSRKLVEAAGESVGWLKMNLLV